jgi:hypothetical protein
VTASEALLGSHPPRRPAERGRAVVFAIPGEATWSLPVYELAMMAAVDLRDRGVMDSTLTIVAPEPEPLRLFGATAGAARREQSNSLAAWHEPATAGTAGRRLRGA